MDKKTIRVDDLWPGDVIRSISNVPLPPLWVVDVEPLEDGRAVVEIKTSEGRLYSIPARWNDPITLRRRASR